jgi:hypothetical protein
MRLDSRATRSPQRTLTGVCYTVWPKSDDAWREEVENESQLNPAIAVGVRIC